MQKNCVNSRFEHTASFSSMEYNDRKIENSLSVEEVYQTKLFIGGLSWDTTKEKLRDYFSKYGEVEDCVLMTDTSSGRSRGFGFVTFKDVSAVKAVLSEKFHQLDGKIIDPKIAIPKNTKFDSKISTSPASSFFNEPSIGCFSHYNQVKKLMEGSSSEAPSTAITPSCRSRTSSKQSANLSCSGVVHSNKIFVGGIGNTTERELRNYFSKYGIITDVTIMMDKSTGRPRGFAFIGFESNSSAELTSSIRYHVIKFKQIEVKKALPKDPKNNQLNYSIYSDYAENGLVNVNTNNVNKTEMSDLKKIKLEDKISYLNDEWDFNDAFKNHSKMDDFYSMHNNITSILVEDKVKIGHNSYKNPQYPTKNDSLFLDKSVSAKNFRVRNHTWCEAVGLSSGITDDTKNNIIQLLDEIWKNT